MQCCRKRTVSGGTAHRQNQTATLTVRRLDLVVKERLRPRAAQRGHSMEEEARRILSESCGGTSRPENLADIAKRLFGDEHGVDLKLSPGEVRREPLSFDCGCSTLSNAASETFDHSLYSRAVLWSRSANS
jgi:plasmid stability protein